jgi:protein-disulfide isomerase
MTPDLTSASVSPAIDADHVRGEGREFILYMDLACPHCAAVWPAIERLPVRLVFRHFPVASKHPRSPALHAAAEASALQGGDPVFWKLVESIYADQGRIDDPHLWERVRRLGLDLGRFERDRRSDAVTQRVRHDFAGGIRAGVVGTPAAFVEGRVVAGDLASEAAL